MSLSKVNRWIAETLADPQVQSDIRDCNLGIVCLTFPICSSRVGEEEIRGNLLYLFGLEKEEKNIRDFLKMDTNTPLKGCFRMFEIHRSQSLQCKWISKWILVPMEWKTFPFAIPQNCFVMTSNNVEYQDLSFHYWENLKPLASSFVLVDGQEALNVLKAVKQKDEIELIRRAVRTTHSIFELVRARISSQKWSEHQLCNFILKEMIRLDVKPAFPPIVLANDRGIQLHQRPSKKVWIDYREPGSKLERGGDEEKKEGERTHSLILDFGVSVGGFCADVTRTWTSDAKISKIVDFQENLLKHLQMSFKPGIRLADLHALAKSYADDHFPSSWPFMTHLIGHHIGFEVHDCGSLSFYYPLQDGMTIALEPGYYNSATGIAVRTENVYVVNNSKLELLI